MLKEIVSISGKPGLFKILNQAKNMIIVESLIDGKRIPAYSRDKVVSLSEIAIYTNTGEIILGEVFESIKKNENGEKVADEVKADSASLREYLATVLPDFDEERVYPSDIKKLINWYNLLIDKGFTQFVSTEDEETASEKEVAKKTTDKETKKAVVKNTPNAQNKQVKAAQKPVTNRKMGG